MAETDAVIVSYDENNLTYRVNESSNDKEKTIPKENIIGLFPTTATSQQQTLLYVEISEDEGQESNKDGNNGNGTKKSKSALVERTYFRSLTISNPSSDLLEDFAASDLSWLLPLGTFPNRGGSPREQDQEREEKQHKVTILVSTGSGTQSAEAAYKNLVQPFFNFLQLHTSTTANERIDPEIIHTTSPTSISDWTASTLSQRARLGVRQTVILLSGDGGLVEILNAMLSTDAPSSGTYRKPCVALMPLGTGNALAHSSTVAADNTVGLSSLLRGTRRNVPLMRIALPPYSTPLDSRGNPVESEQQEGNVVAHGAVVFSWCLHASLVADSDGEEYRRFGAQRFQIAAKENLFPSDGGRPHVYQGVVEVLPHSSSSTPSHDRGGGGGAGDEVVGFGDGEDDGGREAGQGKKWQTLDTRGFSYLLLTLVSNLEETFCISPSSKPLDGRLRLVHMPELEGGGEEMMRVMTLAYDGGKHIDDKAVGYSAVDGVRLRIDEGGYRWRRVCVDGKIYIVGKNQAEDSWIEVLREKREVVDLMVR